MEESRRLILTADEKQTLNLFLPPAVKVTVGVGWEVASERKHKQGGGDEIKKRKENRPDLQGPPRLLIPREIKS